jgi:tRNA(Ile)-lysidine synthase
MITKQGERRMNDCYNVPTGAERLKVLNKVYRTIEKYDLIPPGSGLVVGVSGGVDSLALTHILYTLRRTWRCIPYVATLDHGLRDQAGVDDANFVVEQARRWGLPVLSKQVDVKSLAAETDIGIEAAARLARYNFLAEAAEHFGTKLVAVAHHAGDQAETVLMHLIRGSGLHGLGGMSPKAAMPGHPHLTLIRPLLHVMRAEIEAYCREHGLVPRQDATNRDTTYLRNYLRHETLPHLERLNPNIQRSLAQLAETAQVEDDYVQSQLDTFVEAHVSTSDEHVTVTRADFEVLHPALQRRLVIWAVRKVRSEIESLSYTHIVEAVEIAVSGKHKAIALLTQGVRLRVEYDTLFIEHQDTPPPTVDQPLMGDGSTTSVNIPGQTILPDSQWMLVAEVGEGAGDITAADKGHLAISEHQAVTVRGRRRGDRFAPLGMSGHTQKLNRWMINRKVPQYLREQIPLICVDDEIAAIYMDTQWFISHNFALRDETARTVKLQFEKHL